MEPETNEKVKEPNRYKAKLHVAIGKFNYMEVEVEGEINEICEKAEYLNTKYLNKGI